MIAIGQLESEGPAQDAGNSGFRIEPIVPPILFPTAQSSSSTIIASPSPQLDPPAAIHDFFVDQLPLPNSRSAVPSICPEEDTSRTQDRDTDVRFPPFRSDLEGAQTISSGLHDTPVFSSFSPLTLPPLLLPSTPISDPSRRIALIPPSCPPSPVHPQSRTSIPYPSRPSSPKVFCDLTHEQLRLAIKQHNANVDARLSSHAAINTDKNNVVFHPDTNDNGTYATGSDPLRKQKNRRQPTPFSPEGSSSSEEETVSDPENTSSTEDEEDEKPEPEVEVEFEELVEEAHLAKLRGRRRMSRSATIPAMVLAKPLWPDPDTKPPAVAQRSTSTPSSPALSSINEEERSGDPSGVPPYTVVFVGASGSPDEVWKLPVPAFMLIKSSVVRQPQAQKLRVEQVPRLRLGGPPTNFSSSRTLNLDTQSRSSKKRDIDCVDGIEYLEQTSKRARQDQSTLSSCIIC